MATKNRHNAAFVVGAVIGGLAGAAVALWKTPYSGEELRTMLTGGGPNGHTAADTIATGRLPEPTWKERVISTAENLLAPVVGVELGETANDSGLETSMTSERMKSTDSMGPGAGERPAAGTPDPVQGSTKEPPAAPGAQGGETDGPFPNPYKDTAEDYGAARVGDESNVTPVDDEGGAPSRMSSPTEPTPAGDAATIEELTTPQTEQVPDALKHEHHEMQPFPKLGGNEDGKD